MPDQTPHERWSDDALAPVQVGESGTYPGVPAGPVRRAALYDQAGTLLGHVWTDDREAAGFVESPGAGAAGVRAGARVWRIMADAYVAEVPAAALLNPELYAPDFRLEASGTTP